MLEGKAVIGETDMLQNMQQDALDLAAKALDSFDVTEATDIARFIKKVLVDPLSNLILLLFTRRIISMLTSCRSYWQIQWIYLMRRSDR